MFDLLRKRYHVAPTGDDAERWSEEAPVTLRRSCDLCVRLKRACDGKNPCHLCHRRRETCTRSVKRKSGPAKGTKYTTRRQRMEAGIADPIPPSANKANSKARGKSTMAGNGGGGMTGTGGPAAEGMGSGGGGGAEGGGGGHTPGKRGQRNNHIKISNKRPPPTVNMKPDSAMSRNSFTWKVGGSDMAPTASPSNSLGGGARVTEASAPVGENPRGRQQQQMRRPAFSGAPSHDGGNANTTALLPSGRNGIDSNSNAGGGGCAADVVPRRSVSPLCLPVLSWPSPAMVAPSSASTAATPGGGTMDGGGADFGQSRSVSPFGLLSVPPPALAGKPRRGGTREPPVEAGAVAVHYRAPPPAGPVPSKRYRMSPPYSPRDMLAGQGQRWAGDGILGMPLNGAGNVTARSLGSGPPFYDGHQQSTAPAPSVFSRSPPSKVGSFDSSNALGAILDGRRLGNNFSRGVRGANNVPDQRASFLRDGGEAFYTRQQEAADLPGMRFLPRPFSTGGGETGMPSIDEDPASRRWRQLEDANEGAASLEERRWVGGAGVHQQNKQYQQRHGDNGAFVGGFAGGSSGVVIDPARDLLAESAAVGRNGLGWSVNDPAPRTVLITHGDDDDDDVAGGGGGGASLAQMERLPLADIGASETGATGVTGRDGNLAGERGSWEFHANAVLPPGTSTSSGAVTGGVVPNGIGGVVGDGSDSGDIDMGTTGFPSAAAVSGGGMWSEDPLSLPSPAYSTAVKAGLLHKAQRQDQQQQGGRMDALPLAPSSGSDLVGGGRGSWFVGDSFRGGSSEADLKGSMDNFRGSGAPSLSLWNGTKHTPGPELGGTQRSASPLLTFFRSASAAEPNNSTTPAAAAATAAATVASEAWGRGGRGGDEGVSSFLDASPASARERDPSTKNYGINGAWQTSWGAVHGQRTNFDRGEGEWHSEYSI